MENETTYEFKLDQYHNNYANVRTVANGLKAAKAAGNQTLIDFFEKKTQDVIVQEAEFFKAGVEAAGSNAKKFFEDVLNNYPNIKDSLKFKERLQQLNLTEADLDLKSAYKMPQFGGLKLSVAKNAVVVTAAIADYKEAAKYIHNPRFGYLSEDAKSEYPYVYTSAKLLLNPTMDLEPEFGYSGFRDWALKVNLHEEDWVRLDPTPMTQNYINHGLPAKGIPNPLQNLESSI